MVGGELVKERYIGQLEKITRVSVKLFRVSYRIQRVGSG